MRYKKHDRQEIMKITSHNKIEKRTRKTKNESEKEKKTNFFTISLFAFFYT